MTIGAAIPVVVMHGIVTPFYTMRTLKIPLGRYLMESMLRPIAASAPFVLALLAIQYWFAPQSLWAIAGAGIAASPVLVVSSYYLAFNREDRVRLLHRFIPATRPRSA